MDHRPHDTRNGYAAAIAAYLIWGMLPVYFKLVGAVGPLEIVAHRVLWSLALLLLVIGATRRFAIFRTHLVSRATLIPLSASTLLIAVNWIVYVLAVNNDHILAASLGYFLNPLVSVLLGVVVLKERLRRAQVLAAVIAAVGAANLALSALDTLWISLVLALSFAFYGLVRKTAPVDALTGLAIETMLLAPLSLAYLAHLGSDATLGSGASAHLWILIALSGVITSVPLLLFGYSTHRLPLATIGLLQFIAPSMQFLIGLLLYRETLDTPRLASFVFIWAGLALFTWDAVRFARGAANRV